MRAELKRKRKMEEESEDDENDITLLGEHGDVVVTISRIIRRAENKLNVHQFCGSASRVVDPDPHGSALI